jgi:hypothetical protein
MQQRVTFIVTNPSSAAVAWQCSFNCMHECSIADLVTTYGVSKVTRSVVGFTKHNLYHKHTRTVVSSVTIFTALIGIVFQQRTLLRFLDHVLAGWRPISHKPPLLEFVCRWSQNSHTVPSLTSWYDFALMVFPSVHACLQLPSAILMVENHVPLIFQNSSSHLEENKHCRHYEHNHVNTA